MDSQQFLKHEPITNKAHWIIILVFSCAFTFTYAQTGQALSLTDAISIACNNNPKITQYKEKLEGKKCERSMAFGNFFPTISLSAGYTAMNDALVMDLDPIRDAMISLQSNTYTKMAVDSLQRVNNNAVPPAMVSAFKQQYGAGVTSSLDRAIPHFIDTLKEKYYPSANIMVTQPLFMGGKIVAAQKAAKADLQAAKLELEKTNNEIMQETFVNYCSVALLKNVVTVRKDVLDGMEKHEKNARSLCEAGVIAKTNLLRAQVAVAEAHRALDDDANRLTLAKLALGKSLNLDDTINIDISDTMYAHRVMRPIDEYIKKADLSQPLIAIVNTRIEAAHAKAMAEQASFFPRVAAYGKAELFPDYLSALEPKWACGVNVNLDIFNGGKNISRYQAAQHLLLETESISKSAHKSVHLWVRSAYIECCNANSRYNKLIIDEELAKENLRQCHSRFENGYGTSLEAIDAELALEKNRIEKILALYDFYKSYMDLCIATNEPQKALSLMSISKEIY